jgi:hypothetical protein
MLTYFRIAAAVVLGSIVASGAWASSPADLAFPIPDDAQAQLLPGLTALAPNVTASSSDVAPLPPSLTTLPPDLATAAPVARETAVWPVSDTAAAAGGAAATEAADENSGWNCDGCDSPLWYGSAGVVFLHRDRPSAGTIIGALPSGTPAFSRGSDFEFGWTAGPDLTIARRIGCNDFVEGRYFSSEGSGDTRFVTPGPFIGAGFTGPGDTTIFGRNSTRLDSGEINWRRQAADRLALLAGFRWAELDDGATYKIGPTAAADYNYINHLFGGQIGADWALTNRLDRLQLDVAGKVGVYGNRADGGVTQLVGGSPVQSFVGQGTATAFLGELDCSASYALTNHIAVRGGYQLLWLTDLALATDAANRSLVNPTLLQTVSSNGQLFYQGATLSVDFAW